MNTVSTGRCIGLASLITVAAMAQAAITVYVNGNMVNFRDVGPTMSHGRVLVPLRGVFEEMGAKVQWKAATRTVVAWNAATKVSLQIGKRDAMVNGHSVVLDVPASLVGGRTMVPLRFVSEALGASVRWDGNMDAVRINTNVSESGSTSGIGSSLTLPEDTVIPIALSERLSSKDSDKGDRFTAEVRSDSGSSYLGLPVGSIVRGTVQVARAKQGENPGVLALDFNSIKLPNGKTYPIDGTMIGLDNDSVSTESNGRIVAKPAHRNDRLSYVGIGAGAGAIFALLSDRSILTDAAIGAALGYLLGSIQKGGTPRDVDLPVGTALGVRLDRTLVIQ
ncbi:MAG: copper amine oxidase N-terminal domain-containing protein [Fimbriimonadales bacterium]